MDVIAILTEVQELEEDKLNKNCQQLAEGIKSNQLTILQLVEHLGVLLVNTEPQKRKLGLIILSNTFQHLPSGLLNNNQLEQISKFYVDRLKDSQTISEALKGILSVLKFDNFPDGQSAQLLASLFQNVACQQQPHNDRYTIYEIFQITLERHKSEICAMGLDYVYGVISSVDSERDPRNLLFLFKWMPLFLHSVSLGHLIEEMFEVLACYFPVDFRAPPQDKNAVTREVLADELSKCLTAIPEFAEFCFPLALEKLDSSLEIAKADSLKLLRVGCKNFNTKEYFEYSAEMWPKFLELLLKCPEEKLQNECLQTVQVIIEKITQNNENDYKSILKDMIDSVKGNLINSSKLFEKSSKILLSIALGSKLSAAYVVSEIMPLVSNLYNMSTLSNYKIELLKFMTNLFIVYYKGNNNDIDLNYVLTTTINASLDLDYHLKSAGFECLFLLTEYLPQNVRFILYENLQKSLIEPLPFATRESVLKCFKKLAIVYNEEVKNNVICKLQITDVNSLNFYLEVLYRIVEINYFTSSVMSIFLNNAFKDIETAQFYLEYLKKILENHNNNVHIQEILSNETFANDLISFTIKNLSNKFDRSTLTNVSCILKNVIGFQNNQNEIVNKHLNTIKDVKNTSEAIYVILLDGLVSRVRKEIVVDSIIIEDLVHISLLNDNDFIRNTAAQLLANLINKKPNDEEFARLLYEIQEICVNKLETNTKGSIFTMSWITKALFMRNYSLAHNWSDLLLNLLNKYNEVALGFQIIMKNECEVLSLKCNCNIMLMYRQKFFNLVTNALSKEYTPEKQFYLTAIGYLLKDAPLQIIVLQFKKIIKLVIHCLEYCEEPDVLCALLQTIKNLISSSENVIEDNLEDFLLRLLEIASFQASMNVRLLALECIQQYAKQFPVYKLLPHKNLVLSKLGKSLDDRKRIVRRQAVEARSLWFLLDAPI